MIISYTVCAYCFRDLEVGHRCNCFLSQEQPIKIAMRYEESLEADVKNNPLGILGGKVEDAPIPEMPISGASIAVRLVLSMDIKLCRGCQKEFRRVCDSMADIINKCACTQLEAEEEE